MKKELVENRAGLFEGRLTLSQIITFYPVQMFFFFFF